MTFYESEMFVVILNLILFELINQYVYSIKIKVTSEEHIKCKSFKSLSDNKGIFMQQNGRLQQEANGKSI